MTKRIETKSGNKIIIDDNEPDEYFVPEPATPEYVTNNFWEVVETRSGLKYNGKTLWQKAQKYFRWIRDNSFFEEKPFATGYSASVKKMRSMTEGEFLLYAGVDERQWQMWKKGERGNHKGVNKLQEVSLKISKIIYEYKFAGAASDFLNANIISRELGLADKMINENVAASVLVNKDELIELSKQLDGEI